MTVSDANLLSPSNALEAFNRSDFSIRPISSIQHSWVANNATISVTDERDYRYVPDYFSFYILPSSQSSVLLYLPSIPLPTDRKANFIATFHASIYSETGVNVAARIAPINASLPDGITTNVKPTEWETTRANEFAVPLDADYTHAKAYLQFSEHGGLPILMTMPVFMNGNYFLDNNFVNTARRFMPTYYWDIDAQQEPLSYPMFRLFDIMTHDANETSFGYSRFFRFENTERLASDPDDELTLSTLVDPAVLDDANSPWLSQFTGTTLRSNLDANTISYEVFLKTTTSTDAVADPVSAGEIWAVFDGPSRHQLYVEETPSTNQLFHDVMDLILDENVVHSGAGYTSNHLEPTPRFGFWLNPLLVPTSFASRVKKPVNFTFVDPVTKRKSSIYGVIYIQPPDLLSTEISVLSGSAFSPSEMSFSNADDGRRLLGYAAAAAPALNKSYADIVTFSRYDSGFNNVRDGSIFNSYIFDTKSTDPVPPADVDAYGRTFAFGFNSAQNQSGQEYGALAIYEVGEDGLNSNTAVFDHSSDGNTNPGASHGRVRVSYDGTHVASMRIASNDMARVYAKNLSTGVWSMLGDAIETDVADIALSSDGQKLLVISTTGLISLFEYDITDGWVVNRPTIQLDWTYSANAGQKMRCDMNANGSFIAVSNPQATYSNFDDNGDPYDFTDSGKLTTYKWTGSEWREIVVQHGVADNLKTGTCIKIDSFGRTLTFSDEEVHVDHSPATGNVHVYDLSEDFSIPGTADTYWDYRATIAAYEDIHGGVQVNTTDFGFVFDASDDARGLYIYGRADFGAGETHFARNFAWDYETQTYIPCEATNDYTTLVDAGGSFSSIRQVGISKAASFYSNKELFTSALQLNEMTVGPELVVNDGAKSLFVVFRDASSDPGSSSSQNAAFEAALDALTDGGRLVIGNANNGYGHVVTYDGSYQFEQHRVIEHSANQTVWGYRIFYKDRATLLFGDTSPYPEADQYCQTSPTYGGDVGIFVAPQSATTLTPVFSTDEEKADFKAWQFTNGFYGFKAGSRESMIEASKQVLSGGKTVAVSPNYNLFMNRIHIRTLTSETPNVNSLTTESADVLAAVQPTRPAGYFFTHETVDKLFFTLNNIGIGRLNISVLGT